MKFRRAKRPSTAMDMGPLLDCVLQLLIFFMLSSTFMSPKIRIELPAADTGDGTTESDVITISAAEDGRVFVNQNVVAMEQLDSVLRPLLEASKKKIVAFRGDKTIPYETFIRVINIARRAGAVHLDIAHTMPKGSM